MRAISIDTRSLKINFKNPYRAAAPAFDGGGFGFTRKGDAVYALMPLDEGKTPPGTLLVPWTVDFRRVTLVKDGREISATVGERGISVKLGGALSADDYALVLKIER